MKTKYKIETKFGIAVNNGYSKYVSVGGNVSNMVLDSKVTFTSLPTIYLFGRNNVGTIDQKFTGKAYSVIMYDREGFEIRNYIPCYRKSDGEVGMYDTVSKQFFTNQGTGKFTYGTEVY